jgi:hypothetical protein
MYSEKGKVRSGGKGRLRGSGWRPVYQGKRANVEPGFAWSRWLNTATNPSSPLPTSFPFKTYTASSGSPLPS